jgi:hypothetical protein
MNKVNSFLRAKIFLSVQLLLGILLAFRFLALGVLLSFRNYEIAWFLPILLLIDILTNSLIKTYTNNRTLTDLLDIVSKNSCKIIDNNPFIIQILKEISQYGLFIGGNKSGTKKVTFLRIFDDKTSNYVSYPVFENESYVLVSKSICIDDQTQRVLLTHEAVHCISDDLSEVIEYNIKLFCIVVAILSIFTVGAELKLLAVFLLDLFLYGLQNWRAFYSEIVANNLTIEILSAIPERISKETSAKILQRPSKMKLSLDSDLNKVDEIKLNLQIKYLENVIATDSLIEYSSPLNTPMILLIIALVLLTMSSDKYLMISEFKFQWLFITIFAIISSLLVVINLVLNQAERKKRWKIQSCTGTK